MSDEWKVAQGAPRCSRCQEEFQKGRALFSALTEQGEDLIRRDFCPDCWEQSERGEFFCFWKTCHQTEERRPKIATEVVFDLFANLADGQASDKKELLFVLGLYLTRRKALKLVGVSRRGEQEFLRFRRPRRHEIIEVEDPQLTEGQISAATDRLKELFQAEF